MTKRFPIFRCLLCAVALFYYIWMAAQIPYAHDDWAWGVQTGLRWFHDASINSRYAGNAIEIVLTRSPFLKTLLMGFTFASIPIVSVEIVKTIEGCEWDLKQREKYIYLFFLANALMLFIPTDTWMQTFGWVAGFSNYVMVSLAMLIYLLVIINSEVGRKTYKTVSLILLFLFSIIMQLFVENITVCTLALTVILCIRDIVKNKKIRPVYLTLFIGNLIGTAIMFSSPIYTTLLETGSAVEGVRKLEINRGANLISEAARLIRFFLFYYPDQIWSSNTWVCCYICLALSLLYIVKKKGILSVAGVLVNAGFLVYFLYIRFFGKVNFSSSWWTGVFSAGISLLFFLCVLIQCMVLFDCKGEKRFLIFFWIAAPALMLPLVVVVTGGGRCCLPTQILQILFCLMLTVKIWDCCKYSMIKYSGIFIIILSFSLCVGMGKIYSDIGTVKRIRDHNILLAQKGIVNSIQMKAFPHGKYLWNADPVYGSEMVDYFREYYKIPDDVALWFDTWKP